MMLNHLSDDALVASLHELCLHARRLDARVVAHLIEVEERRVHLKAACSSLFDFCVRRLGMSEGAAFRRINAARLARRFPSLLAHIESGVVHLSTLVLLRDVLAESNVDELVAATSGMTKREVQELVARRAPRPDVPSSIRRLPPPASAPGAIGIEPSEAPAGTSSLFAVAPARPATKPNTSSEPNASIASDGAGISSASSEPSTAVRAESRGTEARRRARIEPLSESRYKVQLTVSGELRDKLERAMALLRHRNPSGDLAVVLEFALDALLTKLEKERLAKTPRPRRPAQPRATPPATPPSAATSAATPASAPTAPATPTPPSTRSVPAHVRREVFARDGERCTYLDDRGCRCPSRAFLELDHVDPRALGGAHDSGNLRVLCRAHNQLYAENVFGRKCVERGIHFRQRKSARDAATRGGSLLASRLGKA